MTKPLRLILLLVMAAAILYANAELLHDHIDELTKKNETGAGQ